MNTARLMLIVIAAAATTGCPKPPPNGDGDTSNIPFGTYTICGVAEIAKHDLDDQPLMEDHLSGSTRVKIEKIDKDTVVSFLKPETESEPLVFAVAARPDAGDLRSVGAFQHKTQDNRDVNLLHQVKVHKLDNSKGQTSPEGCNGSTVLAIQFCTPFTDEAGNTGFRCPKAEQEAHGGDVHAQF